MFVYCTKYKTTIVTWIVQTQSQEDLEVENPTTKDERGVHPCGGLDVPTVRGLLGRLLAVLR